MIDEEITLKKLEVFLAFMKIGNMSRVSEEMSQSVVSVHRALHSLEEGLRCPLFKLDGRRLIPLQSAYCGSKAALRAFTDSVRVELLHDHSRVRIGMVQLPAVNTPQFDVVRSRG